MGTPVVLYGYTDKVSKRTEDLTMMFKVMYSGGESRWNPGAGVDYMQVMVEDADGEAYTLYAEIDPDELCDENGNPAMVDGEFNSKCEDPERLSAPYLIKAIREMCAEIEVDPSCIDFDGYDAEDMPKYMMRGVEAESRID